MYKYPTRSTSAAWSKSLRKNLETAHAYACTAGTHLRGKGSGQCVRGLLAVGGGSLRLRSDWLLCTCLSTLLFRSSSVVMIVHCQDGHTESRRHTPESKHFKVQQRDHIYEPVVSWNTISLGDSFSLISRIITSPHYLSIIILFPGRKCVLFPSESYRRRRVWNLSPTF